jgi:hypothetical protein
MIWNIVVEPELLNDNNINLPRWEGKRQMAKTKGKICEWCEEAEAKREIELYQEDVASNKGSPTSVELCEICYELMQDDDLIETVLSERKRYRS